MTSVLTVAPLSMFLNRVWCGDAETFLRSLPPQSVNCIVTSPPYFGLRNYGVEGQMGLEDTPDAYVRGMVELFRVARRVLRDDGVMWLNLGDSYSADVGGKCDLSRGQFSKHARTKGYEYHIQSNRNGKSGLPGKNLIGIPWRVALALQADGWYLRADVIWAKPNPMPESVQDRPTRAHEYVFLLTKSARYWYDADAIREPAVYGENRATWAGGTERIAKANVCGGGFAPSDKGLDRPNTSNRNRRSVWTIPTEPTPFAHFATFPQALIEPMILAGCPAQVCAQCGAPYVREVEKSGEWRAQHDRQAKHNGEIYRTNPGGGVAGVNVHRSIVDHGFRPACDCHADTRPGIVCDPFMGSGTTAIVAQRLGRSFVGSDLNPEYVALANDRVKYAGDDRRMLDEKAAGVEQLSFMED